MDKDKIMEQLVAKFLDGATSNEEERRLYDYFTGSRVASHLHKYKAMFEWYAGGMAAPLPPVAEPGKLCLKIGTDLLRRPVFA